VDVDRARAARVAIAPRTLQERLAREDPAAMLREKPQQLELRVGQLDPPAGMRTS
jgi:hypothetical protein